MPDSIQIVVGETYDFGEAISGAEGIASISGTALTGAAQGTGNVTSADDSCFVVVRDPNAIAYLYGISRLTTHYQGDSFALTGTIYSRYPIYEITVRVGDAAGDEILVSQTVNSEYRYPLANIDSQADVRPAHARRKTLYHRYQYGDGQRERMGRYLSSGGTRMDKPDKRTSGRRGGAGRVLWQRELSIPL